MDRFLNQCIDVLKSCGAEVVDPADLPTHNKWNDPEFEVLLYEFKADLNAYLAKLPDGRTLETLIDFNEKNRSKEMPWFEQEIFQLAQGKGPLTEKKYLDARQECLRLTRAEGIDAVLEKNKLDAIVTLTSGPAWLIDTLNRVSDAVCCSQHAP